jgi:hypothetical protein
MIQLYIKKNNEWKEVVLSGASITRRETSPLLTFDTAQGEYSFPFDIPARPNGALFDHPELHATPLTFPARVVFHSRTIEGELTVIEGNEDVYQCTVAHNIGVLAQRAGTDSLRDIDFGTDIFRNKPQYTYPTDNYALFPVHNFLFFPEGSNFQEDYVLNSQLQNYWDVAQQRFRDYADSIEYLITPFPFLCFVLKKLLEYYGFQLVENWMEQDNDMKNIVFYNNSDIATTAPNYVNQEIEVTDNHGRTLCLFLYAAFFDDWIAAPFQLADMMPDMTVTDFLKSMMNFCNSYFIFSEEKVSFKKRVLRFNTFFNIEPFLLEKVTFEKHEKTTALKFTWEHDTNDYLVQSMWKDINKMRQYYIGETTIANLSALQPAPNTLVYVPALDSYLIYRLVEPENAQPYYAWGVYSLNFQNETVTWEEDEKKNEKSIKVGFSTLIYHKDIYGMHLPMTQQQGRNYLYPNAQENKPKLLIYHGIGTHGTAVTYPYASSTCYGKNEYREPNRTLEIRFDGQTGIYRKFYSSYLAALENRTLKKLKTKINVPYSIYTPIIYRHECFLIVEIEELISEEGIYQVLTVASIYALTNTDIGNHNLRYNNDMQFSPVQIFLNSDFIISFSYTNVMDFAVWLSVHIIVSQYEQREIAVAIPAGETYSIAETYENAPAGTITATIERDGLVDDTISTEIIVPHLIYQNDLQFYPAEIPEDTDFSVSCTFRNNTSYPVQYTAVLSVTGYPDRTITKTVPGASIMLIDEDYTNAQVGTITAAISHNSTVLQSINTIVLHNSTIAYFYNTAIEMQANTLAGPNWSTIETIAPADNTLPVAQFSLSSATGKVLTAQAGYAAGFIIRHANGTVLAKCHLVEGTGTPYSQNNITYNVRSGSGAGYGDQAKFFRIANITIRSFWVQGYRYTKPYAAGYSTETYTSTNLIQYGDCSNYPRTADGYLSVGSGITYLLQNSNLRITNTTAVGYYGIGSRTANTIYTIGFYRAEYSIISATSGVLTLLMDESRVFGHMQTFSSMSGNILFYADVNISAILLWRLSHKLYTAGTVTLDNISCRRISHPYGTQVPAHETNTGYDALGYALTNP